MQVTTGTNTGSQKVLSHFSLIAGLMVMILSAFTIWLYGSIEQSDMIKDKQSIHQKTINAIFQSQKNSNSTELSNLIEQFSSPSNYQQNTVLLVFDDNSKIPVYSSNRTLDLDFIENAYNRLLDVKKENLTKNLFSDVYSTEQSSIIQSIAPIKLYSLSNPTSIVLITDISAELNAISKRKWRIASLVILLEGILIAIFWLIARRGDQKLLQSEKEQQAMENELFFLAHYDPLTHLPNRTLFWERLDAATSRANRLNKSVALMLFDIKDFTKLNDEFGRSVGDVILKEVSRRIQSSTRSADLICRIGADEFAIVLEDLDGDGDVSIPKRVLSTIEQQFSQPFSITDEQYKIIKLNHGCSQFPLNGATSEELLAHAKNELINKKDSQKII